MFIERIIEFELRGPGPPGRTFTHITDYFRDIRKICQENLRVDYYLRLKYCRRQCTLLSFTWAKSLKKLNPKMQGFKRVLDLTCK